MHIIAQHINGHGDVTTQHESMKIVQQQKYTVEMVCVMLTSLVIIKILQIKHDGEMDDVIILANQLLYQSDVMKHLLVHLNRKLLLL